MPSTIKQLACFVIYKWAIARFSHLHDYNVPSLHLFLESIHYKYTFQFFQKNCHDNFTLSVTLSWQNFWQWQSKRKKVAPTGHRDLNCRSLEYWLYMLPLCHRSILFQGNKHIINFKINSNFLGSFRYVISKIAVFWHLGHLESLIMYKVQFSEPEMHKYWHCYWLRHAAPFLTNAKASSYVNICAFQVPKVNLIIDWL